MYHGRYEYQASAHRQSARRRKLNKYFLVTLSLVLLLGIAAGATVAFVTAQGGSVNNRFTPGKVACSVNNDYEITNDGNIDAYIRAAVVVNWEKDGNICGTAPVAGQDYELDWDKTNWEKIDEYYYYKRVVASKGTTPTVVTVTQITDAPSGYALVVEVLAEAIQAQGKIDGTNTKAFQDAWKITSIGG